MSWRNHIVGGIAIALGLTIVILLAIDARWDNHDTTKPIKALFGGFAFIGLGAWYLFRGAQAESWRAPEARPSKTAPESNEGPDITSSLAEMEGLPSFQAERQKVEAEMRERAANMERVFESKLNSE